MDPAYMWDLTTLFESDEAWEKALAEVDDLIVRCQTFSGKLNTAQEISAYYEFDTEAGLKMQDIFCYANLRHSEDTRDSKATSMYARAYAKYVTLSSACAYAEPEILSLSKETLEEIARSPEMEKYAYRFQNLIRQKDHTLTAGEETLLSSLQEALAASGEAADTLMDADLVFDSVKDGNGTEHELTGSGYIPMQMSSDRVLRENSFRSYYKSYKQHIHTFAATYGGCVKAATAEARIRKFNSSREMSMFTDNIPVSVYDNLIDTIHKHMDLMYRYVSLRKKILALDEVHYYDVYAPLSAGSSKKYTYEEAQQMVLSAVAPLGEAYVERVKSAYKDGWIDVYPNKGKTGGAFSSGTYHSNPFILTNFSGSLDSVSTIAHEMGHSQHTWLTSHNQPPWYAGYTMFVAEVASTVNENLLIEQLLEKCDEPKERLALLNQYLDGFKGTVYRQTMFAEFEKEAHAMLERGEALEAEALSSMYEKILQNYFGPEFVMDEEARYEWARIPHFYMPFYVYVYATGYASAVALSEKILHEGQTAVDHYLEFLSMGGSDTPLNELKHAGVDLTTPEPIEKALEKFAKVLDDAEATFAKIQ